MTSAATTTRPALVAAIRAIAALTVVGSAVAVTALTVRADNDTPAPATSAEVEVAPAPIPAATITTPATPPARGGAPNAAVPLGQSGAPSAAVPLGQGGAPNAAVPLGQGGAPNRVVPLAQGGAPNASILLRPGTDGSVPLAAANPFATAPAASQPTCPLGWPAPKQQGGLASLIGLAPLAGPFSSEAFALGSVYQPILQLVGPVLAEIAPVISQNQPLIDPLIARVQSVEALVLEAILPYYGPYRGQLIAAEGDLAKTLAPILDRVYNSEAASCLVAWQGQIIDQAKGGRITVASLAHPGTFIELGPQD